MKTRTFPSALLMLTAAILTLPAIADDQRRHGSFDRSDRIDGKMMRTMDIDDNGEITRDEFTSPAKDRIAKRDSNGDGVVTPEELDADFKQKQAEMITRSSERHTQKRDQFFAQDTNGDGAISADEINDSMFARLDADGSGTISRTEIRPRRKHSRVF